MTTITKERAEIKSFITGFLSDPAHDNQSSDSLHKLKPSGWL